jgi:hypothetical protein
VKNWFNIIFPLSLITLIWIFTATSQTRCSKIGIYILDDIFGLNGVEKTCISEHSIEISNDEKKILKELVLKNAYSDLSKKTKKKCPIESPVIVIIGQSNGANRGKSYIFENKVNLNYNPIDGMCYELSEPVLGAAGTLDSITSSIGKKVKSTKTVLFVNTSVDGSTISNWNELYAENLNAILKKILDKNFLKAIIWMQGESENQISSTKYYENFLILKDLIFKGLKVKFQEVDFIITKSTYCNDDNPLREMNEQRKLIKKQFSNVKLLEITDNLDNSYRHDKCHLNREGIKKVSAEIAKIINLND